MSMETFDKNADKNVLDFTTEEWVAMQFASSTTYRTRCLVQPLNNVPISEEPGLSVVGSLGKVGANRQIPVVIANTASRDYTLRRAAATS